MRDEALNPDILRIDTNEGDRLPVEDAGRPSARTRHIGHKVIADYISEMAASQPGLNEAA